MDPTNLSGLEVSNLDHVRVENSRGFRGFFFIMTYETSSMDQWNNQDTQIADEEYVGVIIDHVPDCSFLLL